MSVTHHAMNDSVFPEQNDFARGADEPFTIFSLPHLPHWLRIVSEFLHRTANGASSMTDSSTDKIVMVRACRNGDSTCLKEGMLKVIDEVRRVLDPNTQANEILR